MPRPDINRSGEMEVFVHIVDRGGFAAAGRAPDMTPSAVSKLVAWLEVRLGTQLLHRSTRRLQLTPEDQQFYDRAVPVLADMDEAERCVAAAAAPRGRISLNTSVPLGHVILLPLLPRFLAQYPQIALDIALIFSRFTRSTWANPAGSPRGCGRCSTFSQQRSRRRCWTRAVASYRARRRPDLSSKTFLRSLP